MWFPFKKTFPTPSEYSPWINTCEYIILHHTWTNEWTIQWVLNGLNKRLDYASCHFVVDINWDVYKIWDPKDILWHAWVSSWKWKTDINKYSVWIEIIWPLSDWWFTQEEKTSVFWLTQHLMAVLNIPKENVLRHKDIAPKRKTDIADSFWNWKYKSYIEYVNMLKPREWK